MRAHALLWLCVCACRGGFDQLLEADADVPRPMPDAPPPALLACAGPRFMVDPATTQLAATATQSGYDVFAVNAVGDVRGYSFPFDGDALAPGTSDAAIASNATGPLTPLATDDDILLAMPYGRPTAAGTALIQLDAQLATTGSSMTDGLFGSGGALTRNASRAIALLTQHLETAPTDPGQVDVQLISENGREIDPPQLAIDGSQAAYNQVVLPAKNGFLISWANTSGPKQVRAKLLDAKLMAVSGQILISPDEVSPNAPRAAYLASADRYLFVWYQKAPAPIGDEVWASLRDSNFVDLLGHPILLSGTSQGLEPKVVAGDNDFLVVWRNDTGSKIGAARVSKDGDVTLPGIRSTGGVASAWDVVVRFGQPALLWLESGGIGPNLWFDPLCKP